MSHLPDGLKFSDGCDQTVNKVTVLVLVIYVLARFFRKFYDDFAAVVKNSSCHDAQKHSVLGVLLHVHEEVGADNFLDGDASSLGQLIVGEQQDVVSSQFPN